MYAGHILYQKIGFVGEQEAWMICYLRGVTLCASKKKKRVDGMYLLD